MYINDVVKIKEKIFNSKVTENNLGTIIEVLQDTPFAVYEVEFLSDNGDIIDTLALREDELILLR